MKDLKFEDLPKALELVIERLNSLEKKLEFINGKFQPTPTEELMTRDEVSEYLKVSLTTIWIWSKKGILNSYRIGNKVYYKKIEIENTLVKIY